MRVNGTGPRPCERMLIGSNPGYWESKRGVPFVGKTGDELERLLEANALPPRDKWFLTNLYREFVDKDYTYTSDDLRRDEPALLAELEAVQPSLIVTLGREATRYFLGDVDMEGVHGIGWRVGERVIFPAYHPAAGMHNSDLASYVVADFQALSAYMRGATTARTLYDDPYPEPQYEEITDEGTLDATLCGLARDTILTIDCEGWSERAWSLQFAYQPGTGYLIRASRRDLVRRFVETVRRVRPRLGFHAALADFGIGRGLDVDFVELTALNGFDDSAVAAYLLQIEPRGLKDGALRHCNMRMQSYTDLMGDVENDLARDYLMWLHENERLDHLQRQEEILRAKQEAGSRARKLPNIPKTALYKAVERCLRSEHPARLWREQGDTVRDAGERLLGCCPAGTLDYVPTDRAVAYGCRDADATLRLLPEYGRRLDALGLHDVYDLELACLPLVDRMQRIGLKPDLEQFAALSGRLGEELQTLQRRLVDTTGLAEFNANSGDQVAAYLFGTLGLEEIKQTSSGRGSTNGKILEALEREHPEFPVLADIRSSRELYKLKSTFVDPMPSYVNRWPFDGRVHANFRTTTVVSGRLSASDPNVLAQPEHGTWAKDFKRGWVCDEGHVLCAWDQCLAPSTRVLKADLTWAPIETLRPGDELVAIEEHTTNGKERKTIPATVVRTGRALKHCKRITLSNGRSIVASDEHPWLAKSNVRYSRAYTWVNTGDLQPGCQLCKFVEPWEVETSYDAGWLAGFLDGEGSLCAENGTMCLTQNPGPLMEHAKSLLRERGYDFHVDNPKEHPSGFVPGKKAEVIWMCGVRDCLHLLGTLRPRRLMEKATALWAGRISLKKKRGKSSPVDSSIVYVERVEDIGLQEVVTMETSTRTFVAEGFFTHNSQIELRVLAHLSQDPFLLDAFRSGIDLHAALAERIFDVPAAQQDKHRHRYPAKTIHYLMCMGGTSYGLMQQLRANGVEVDESTAQQWMDDTFALYSAVPTYMEARVEEAERTGMVRSLLGRIRYIGGIHSRDERIRAEAQRFAISFPLQAGAQDIMKQCEVRVWREVLPTFRARNVYCEPLLQQHDSLKFEVDAGHALQLHTCMVDVMTQVPKSLSVPLAVDGEFGPTFADMESFT